MGKIFSGKTGIFFWAILLSSAGILADSFLVSSFLRLLIAAALVIAAVVSAIEMWSSAASSVSVEAGEIQYKSILQDLSDPLVVYDRDFRILLFNAAAEKLFRLKAQDVLGNKIQPAAAEVPEYRLLVQVVYPSLAPVFVSRSPVGQYPQIAELSFTEPELQLRTSTFPIQNKEGEQLGFAKLIRDLTREISLVKEKSEFVTVTSHQLKTPITEAKWALGALLDDQSLNENQRELVKGASDAVELMSKVVADVLDVARLEEGKFGYKFQKTDLVEFLSGILAKVANQAARVDIKLYFDKPSEPLPPLQIDSEKLSMAVLNILDNAVRYNVKNGEIVVRAEKLKDSPFVQISIRDTGIGIPPEDIKKIFIRFFRAENAVKSQTEGSGLGLYIARNIVRAHGGEMRVESELGRGSIFYLTLPTDPSLIPANEAPTWE